MTRLAQRDEAEVRRLAQASAWRGALAEAGVESTAGFEAWLAEDARNAAAWRQVQGPWQAIGDAATSPEVMAARRDALHRARRAGRRRWAARPGVGRRVAASVAVLAVGAALLVFVVRGAPDARDYRTALGERRVVTLADGSKVSLDSASEVTVRYTPGARRLELLRGQGRFDVAHDVARPFSVRARDQTVVATGTAFNIDLMGPQVRVTLIQGRVSVLQGRRERALALPGRPPEPTKPPIRLVAGQELIVTPVAAPRVEAANVERATAWETGQLVFENEPLDAVAARVSRYAPHAVTVEADAATLRISGVFNAGDVATFVDTVTRYLPVRATAEPDGRITLARRG